MNRIEPCFIDGQKFDTVTDGFQYLQEVDGRIHLDRLARYLRQGRRVLDGHVLGLAESAADGIRQDSFRQGERNF